MPRKVFVVGVGMSKFAQVNTGGDYTEFTKTAVENAIKDAAIRYEDINQAVCCNASGKSCSGQRVLYQIGMTGIPIHNVSNKCTSGSTGLFLGKQLIKGSVANIVLVFGFESMASGFPKNETVRRNALDRHVKALDRIAKVEPGDIETQIFANAGLEHMKKNGTTKLQIAKVAAKNYRHGAKNPLAQHQNVYNVDEILNSRKMFNPLTKLECSNLSDGAAAVVLMSEDVVIKFGLQEKAVEIVGIEMVTDTTDIFKAKSCMKLAGYDITVLAANKLYHSTKVSPKEIDVAELHDGCASNEIINYEALQLCGVGEAGRFVDDGDNTYGGRVVVNPSGGLLARGHALGATGLAQLSELVWQLRGEAGCRQVENARTGLQHNQSLGGTTVVAIYKKGFVTR